MGGGVQKGSLRPETGYMGSVALTERPAGGSSLGLSVGGRLEGWMSLEAMQAQGAKWGSGLSQGSVLSRRCGLALRPGPQLALASPQADGHGAGGHLLEDRGHPHAPGDAAG